MGRAAAGQLIVLDAPYVNGEPATDAEQLESLIKRAFAAGAAGDAKAFCSSLTVVTWRGDARGRLRTRRRPFNRSGEGAEAAPLASPNSAERQVGAAAPRRHGHSTGSGSTSKPRVER